MRKKILKQLQNIILNIRSAQPITESLTPLDTIKQSGLFDEVWFRENNHVDGPGTDYAIACYLAADNDDISPHPVFIRKEYRSRFMDSDDCKDPLVHFISQGVESLASPCYLFDVDWYRTQNQLVNLPPADAFRHYLTDGVVKALAPHPLFCPKYYVQQDNRLMLVNPLTHYLECGWRQGLNPNRAFNSSWYAEVLRKQGASNGEPFSVFLNCIDAIGTNPAPDIDLDEIAEFMGAGMSRRDVFFLLVTSDDAWAKVLETRARKTASLSANLSVTGLESNDLAYNRSMHAKLDDDGDDYVWASPLEANRAPTSANSPFLPDNHSEYKFISFDVWDTLLRRNCNPDEIKWQSARTLLLLGWRNLRPLHRNRLALFTARLRHENQSAPNDEFEYRYADALKNWLGSGLLLPQNQTLVQVLKKKMASHEFDAEVYATRVDTEAARLLPNLNATKVVASDFYHSSSFMRSLLKVHGIGNHFEEYFVSSDTYKTKRSGRMFDQIVADLSCDPNEILHIGDNLHADGVMARSRGVVSHIYTQEHEEREKAYSGEVFANVLAGRLDAHDGNILKMLAELENDARATGASELYCFGIRFAPVALLFSLGVLEDSLREDIDTVHFFAREGIFMKRFFDVVNEASPYGLPGPKSSLLEVSRVATFAASLNDLSLSSMMRIWTLYSTQSMAALATTLNADVHSMTAHAARYEIDASELIEHPWLDTRVQALFADDAFQKFLGPVVDEQRAMLTGYLQQSGFNMSGTNIVADIGWRGTIQDNLAAVAPEAFLRGHYVGLFSFLNSQPVNGIKFGHAFDANMHKFSPVDEIAPFEMIFNGQGGSVTGYVRKKKRIEPVKVVIEAEESVVVNEVADIQAGMLSVAQQLCRYVRLHGLMAEDLVALARRIMADATQDPPADLADAFFRLGHNEMFGVGHTDAMDKRDTLVNALESNKGSLLHAAVEAARSNTRWQAGSMSRSKILNWWKSASLLDRQSLPTDVYRKYAMPGLVRSVGSKVTVYAPPPLLGSGGHRTIFNLVRGLATQGIQPVLMLEGVGDGVDVVEGYLGDVQAEIHTEWHAHIPSDLSVATVAHSAMFVADLKNTHHPFYLVQDWESLFNPMSDQYVIAENSYSYGLTHLSIGNWLTHRIQNEFGGRSYPAGPGLGVDTSIYRPRSEVTRERAVCFLYQPDKPRRAPQLGIDALRLIKWRFPDVKIYVYGSNLPINLDFEVENLGLVLNLNTLGELYSRCMVGLCISGSNPSRIPYEMMAAGCVPVDLYRYNNLLDHDACNSLLAYQDPFSIAGAIAALLGEQEMWSQMSSNAIRSASARTLRWEVDVLTNHVMAQVDGKLQESWSDPFVYRGKPFIAPESDRREVRTFCDIQLSTALTSEVVNKADTSSATIRDGLGNTVGAVISSK